MFRIPSFIRPLDLALIAVFIAAAAWILLNFRMTSGSKAIVYVSTRKFAWYDLAGTKKEISVPTRIGEVRLEVGEGMARVLSSPCPNKLCAKTGQVRHTHQEIVCVPAHFLLVVEGDDPGGRPGGEVDAITF